MMHIVLLLMAEVNLTPKEYELLYFLAKSPDKVFDREQLLKEVGIMISSEIYEQLIHM